MQFINNQYNVIKFEKEDKYGSTVLVEDLLKANERKWFRIIDVRKDTEAFIEYMKYNFYDYINFEHPNINEFYFFNKISTIDRRAAAVNKYYYTTKYFEGTNLFEFAKDASFENLLDLSVQLCSAVKYLHLRGYLLCNINFDELYVVENSDKIELKITSLPFMENLDKSLMVGKDNNLIISPESYRTGKFTRMSDIYLIGMIMFYTFSAKKEKSGSFHESFVIFKSQQDDKVSAIVKIIEKCISPSPSERYCSVEHIVNDINKAFNESYNIIDKRYIQTLPKFRVKLIARETQMRILLDNVKGYFFENQKNRVTFIEGGLGTGKSAFLDAATIRLEQEGFKIVFNRLHREINSPFLLITSIIKDVIKFCDKEIVDKYSVDLARVIPELCDNSGQNFEGISKTEVKARLIYRYGNFLMEAAINHPYIICINSASFIDSDSFEVLNYVLKNRNKGKIYMIMIANTENSEENEKLICMYKVLADMQLANNIELANFNINETAEFIRVMLGMDKAPFDFAANIYHHTEGNPYYCYEIIYMLFTNKIIYVNDKGEWVLNHVDLNSLNLSLSVDEITWSKVTKLDNIKQELLRIISVFNTAVSIDVLEESIGIKKEELFEHLNSLIAINIISRRVDDWGISYDFNSINLKKTVYDNLSDYNKFKYHEKVSYILEKKFANEGRENKDELIYHMSKAGRCDEAIDQLIASAEKMISSNMVGQAIQFLEQSYGFFAEDDYCHKKMLITLKLGNLYEQIGDYNKAIFYYNTAQINAEHLDDKKMLVDVYVKKFLLLYRMGAKKESISCAIKAKRILKDINYLKGMLELIINLSDLMLYRRKYNSYIKILEKAMKESCHDKYIDNYKYYYARLLSVYGRTILRKNKIEEALEALLKSTAILEDLGAFKDIPAALNSIGVIYSDYYNDMQKAREYYEKNLAISQKMNNLRFIENSYNNLAELYRLEDRYHESLEYYNKAFEIVQISQNKFLEVLLYLNLAVVYTAMEEYKRASEFISISKSLLDGAKDFENLYEYYYQCKAQFYYIMGNYRLASEYAQKSIDLCKSWGTKINSESVLIKMLAESKETGEVDFDRMLMYCKTVFNESLYKLGRSACARFAELLIEQKKYSEAKTLLELGISVSSKLDSELLNIEYSYLAALCEEPKIKLNKLTEIASSMEFIENNDLKWKICKHIADEMFNNKNYREALKYLISSLNFLRKLAYGVPDEFKIKFILSHNRGSVREAMIRVAKILTEREGLVHGKVFLAKGNEGLSLYNIDKYFDYSDFKDIYRRHGTNNKESGEFIDTNTLNKFLFKLQEVLNRFTDNSLKNLNRLLELCAETVQAKNAFIATLEEDNSLKILTAYNRYSEDSFYKYFIEQANQRKDSIIIPDVFEYCRKDGNILIPKDITAVFCIPISIRREEENLLLLNDRRLNKVYDMNCINGFLYMDTDSIINNFTIESSKLCKLAVRVAYMLIDNYNLKKISAVDKLTKLHTRKFFETALQNELAAMEKKGGEFSIVMIDIDKFKQVNDRFGHQKGDEILQSVASIIMNNLRKTDICGRYGGEEFIVLLPGTNTEGAKNLAEKLRKKVENAKLLGLSTPLTISLGISNYPEHSTWIKDLIDKADQALYRAKELGRNMICIYEPKQDGANKRLDKLAGIISGDIISDQRNVETIIEVLELQRNTEIDLYDKVFQFLGRLIEVSEAQTGTFLFIKENKVIDEISRMKFEDKELEDIYYNKLLVSKVIESGRGEFIIDWGNHSNIDPLTGMPELQSVILVPLTNTGRLVGVLYLSVSIKNKEFDANIYNFIKTLCDIFSNSF